MVGYITVAHGGAQRLSEKWRHFVVHCLYSLFCTSPRCVGVSAEAVRKKQCGIQWPQPRVPLLAVHCLYYALFCGWFSRSDLTVGFALWDPAKPPTPPVGI